MAVKNMMEVLPEIATMPKYASSIKSISSRLQFDLWNLYNNAAHEEMRAALCDDQWIAGRKAWLQLDQYIRTKRVSPLSFP